MDLKILWTETARNQLENIFDYYKANVSPKTAKKIIGKIINTTLILKKTPFIGQKEELLITRKKKHHYLIQGNYKIIYWIEGGYVHIASVYDCRQNPSKMLEL